MLVLAPVLVAAGGLLLLERIGLDALEAEDRAREVRERLQVAGRLELVAGEHRREAQRLGAVGLGGPVDGLVDREPDVLELA